jgi:hypothetical protein
MVRYAVRSWLSVCVRVWGWAEYLAAAVAPLLHIVLAHTPAGNPLRFTAGSAQHTLLVRTLQGVYFLAQCRWLPVPIKIGVESAIKTMFELFRHRKLGPPRHVPRVTRHVALTRARPPLSDRAGPGQRCACPPLQAPSHQQGN